MHPEQSNLESILTTIDGIISIEVDSTDGNKISDRISICAALLSTSANSVAISQKIYNERLAEILIEVEPHRMNATDKKLLLTGRLSEESYWLKYAERINAGLVHAIESYRSMLSYIKEDMKMTNYQQNLR